MTEAQATQLLNDLQSIRVMLGVLVGNVVATSLIYFLRGIK
jgi:hypothetical protein